MTGQGAVGPSTVASEATRYLEVTDLLRSLGLDVTWRCEAEGIGGATHSQMYCEPRCDRCSSPRVRINGRHVCVSVH